VPADVMPPPPPGGDHGPDGPRQPDGALRFLWFDGLLEGPRPEDLGALRRAVQRMNGAGFGEVALSIEGGRFTILMEGLSLPGKSVTERGRTELAQGLQDIVQLLPPGSSVESTLRCTEVFEADTRETLFAAQGLLLKTVVRVRPVNEQDLEHDPGHREIVAPLAMSRGRLVVLASLFLVAVGLLAWQSGYLDRFFGTAANELDAEYGPFAGLLDMGVEPHFGRYRVTVTRGDGYPVTNAEAQQLEADAATPADATAVNIVTKGEELWVRLENKEGKVLVARRIELRKLISAADAKVVVMIDGKIGATIVRLALDEG